MSQICSSQKHSGIKTFQDSTEAKYLAQHIEIHSNTSEGTLKFNTIKISSESVYLWKRGPHFQWSIDFCCVTVMLSLFNQHLLGKTCNQTFQWVATGSSKLMLLRWLRSLACSQAYHNAVYVRHHSSLCQYCIKTHCATHALCCALKELQASRIKKLKYKQWRGFRYKINWTRHNGEAPNNN